MILRAQILAGGGIWGLNLPRCFGTGNLMRSSEWARLEVWSGHWIGSGWLPLGAKSSLWDQTVAKCWGQTV